jgi:hypothetical protein
MTHGQLVRHACAWLRRTERCCIVMREASHLGLSEIPDAIGWRSVWRGMHGDTVCTVVETKVSRSDVVANRRKPPQTLGRHRYLLTLEGLASASDLPEGWGLLIWKGSRAKRVIKAGWNWSRDERHEQVLLVAEMRRLGGMLTTARRVAERKNGLVEVDYAEETQ